MSTIRLEFLKSLYPYKKGEIVDIKAKKYTDLVKKHTRIVDDSEKLNKITKNWESDLSKKEIIAKILEIAQEKELNLDEIKKETRSLNKTKLEEFLLSIDKIIEDEEEKNKNEWDEDENPSIKEDKIIEDEEKWDNSIKDKENKAILTPNETK